MQGRIEGDPEDGVSRVERNVKFGEVTTIIVDGETLPVAIRVKPGRGRKRFRLSVEYKGLKVDIKSGY